MGRQIKHFQILFGERRESKQTIREIEPLLTPDLLPFGAGPRDAQDGALGNERLHDGANLAVIDEHPMSNREVVDHFRTAEADSPHPRQRLRGIGLRRNPRLAVAREQKLLLWMHQEKTGTFRKRTETTFSAVTRRCTGPPPATGHARFQISRVPDAPFPAIREIATDDLDLPHAPARIAKTDPSTDLQVVVDFGRDGQDLRVGRLGRAGRCKHDFSRRNHAPRSIAGRMDREYGRGMDRRRTQLGPRKIHVDPTWSTQRRTGLSHLLDHAIPHDRVIMGAIDASAVHSRTDHRTDQLTIFGRTRRQRYHDVNTRAVAMCPEQMLRVAAEQSLPLIDTRPGIGLGRVPLSIQNAG